jgi:voltage-gated potassium channel Kch
MRPDTNNARVWQKPSATTILLVLAALACGAVGYWQHAAAPRWDDVLVRTIRLFSLGELPADANWLIRAGRICGVIVLFRALMAVYLRFTRERWTAWRAARMKNHVVVFGLGRKGLDAVLAARSAKKRVVVVDKDPDPILAEQAEKAGAFLLVADATESTTISAAGIRGAAEAIAVCADDSVNIDILLSCATLREEAAAASPLRTVIHLRNLHLRDALIRQHWLPTLRKTLDLRFVNFAENTARAFIQSTPFETAPGTGPLHLIIIGFGPVGQAVAVHAARLLHFAEGEKPRISIIAETSTDIATFCARWPAFEAACRATFYELTPGSHAVETLSFLTPQERAERITIIVTADTDERALTLGLSMNRTRPTGGEHPLHIHQSATSSAVALIRKTTATAPQTIHFFGTLDTHFDTAELTAIDTRARTAHERYLRVATAAGAAPGSRPALVPWDELPEDYRNANRAQADHIPIKLRAIGITTLTADTQFTSDQIEHLSRMEHARWSADRLIQGWTHGPRNDAAKTHDCLIPYDQLSEAEKEKDREVVRSIPSLMREAES